MSELICAELTAQICSLFTATNMFPEPLLNVGWFVWLACISLTVILFSWVFQNRNDEGVPSLRDPIPYVYNTLQFMLNNHKFMNRVQHAAKNNPLLRFYLGPQTVYLVTGSRGIKDMFGRDLVHTVTNQEQMTQFALPTLYKMNKSEVQRWKDDKSGVAKTPVKGTESTPTRQRLWFMYEHIYAEYLGEARHFKPIAERYDQNLNEALSSYPAEKWTSISVQAFCRSKVVEASVNSLFGPDLIGLNSDFIDRFWQFDKNVFKLVMGLPRWINSSPFEAHDRYLDAIRTWLDTASNGFDWDSPAAEADWEPCFGGRAPRELIKWMKETGWRSEVIAATVGALVFA